jgi:hypothetical protein
MISSKYSKAFWAILSQPHFSEARLCNLDAKVKGERRGDHIERTLLLRIFQGPLRGHTWSIETNSFPSGSDSSLLFRPVLSHEIHRANKI